MFFSWLPISDAHLRKFGRFGNICVLFPDVPGPETNQATMEVQSWGQSVNPWVVSLPVCISRKMQNMRLSQEQMCS